MVEHGVISYPTLIRSENVDQGTKWGKRQLFQYRATYQVTYLNADNPQEFLEINVEGYADDSGDKGPGKALSYATKYADLKLFKIPTGEDDEARVEDVEELTVRDNENFAMDVRAKTGELFGEDHANDKLQSLARRVFQVDDWLKIPLKHKQVILDKLDAQAARERETEVKEVRSGAEKPGTDLQGYRE